MASFNSMPAMSSGAAPGDAMGLSHGHGQAMVMDTFDQELNFDEALLDGSSLPPLNFTPTYEFDSFPGAFEDPFSYSARQYEPPPPQDPLNDEASPQELDNKLLGFSDPIINARVADETGNLAEMNMTAELYGMFFVAEDVFGGETSGRPLELTCYRRNLWQCSGQITLPRVVSHVVDEQGRQTIISELSASITAMESIEGKATEIISIPWKSANGQAAEESKTAGSPADITLDLASAQELDANLVTIPVSWKRLQFKHATANNGRRKGLQQHYVVQISLLGKTSSGESIKIAEVQSGPVIVRGRSPRNFDSRKDVPLSSEKKLERRSTSGSDVGLRQERETTQTGGIPYQPMANVAPNDWSASPAFQQTQPGASPHPAKRAAISSSVYKPPVPAWAKETPPLKAASFNGSQPQKGSAPRHGTSLPINLSLSEDERSPNRSSAELQSPQLGKSVPIAGLNAGNSPSEEADPLYEYFPLSVDDWMPPVDAVYRPHVVHHTVVPPDIKAQQVQSRSKRYFAAD
ncbi:Protein pacG [Paramyrothecium foliicola]|nr:Protein pacG [Paramyrothecium foliicola]